MTTWIQLYQLTYVGLQLIFNSLQIFHAGSHFHVAAAAAATTTTAANGSKSWKQDWNSFDEFAKKLMACRSIPGLTITAVQLTDEIDFQTKVTHRNYGLADIERRRPMTKHTRVCIASLTKAFSSSLVGQLLLNSSSSYTWDTPLKVILPKLSDFLFDDEWVRDHVTLRDILSHRTGVRTTFDEIWLANVFNKSEIVKRIKYMGTVNEDNGGGSAFRSAAHYNNIIYSLVGHVIENLASTVSFSSSSEITWETLMSEMIFAPLNMSETCFYHDCAGSEEDMAQHYIHYPDVNGKLLPLLFEHSQLSGGSAAVASSVAVCSTSSDMVHWLKELLIASTSSEDDGRTSVIAASVLRDTFQMHISAEEMIESWLDRPLTDVPFVIDGYGLGWFTGHYRGWKIVSHYGSLIGSYSMITIIPSARLGIFTSYNGAAQQDPYTISTLLHAYIADIGLGSSKQQYDIPSHLTKFIDAENNIVNNASEPWWCQATLGSSDGPMQTPLLQAIDPDILELVRSAKPRSCNCCREVTQYVGRFEHPVLGAVDISCVSSLNQVETCEEFDCFDTQTMHLIMRYGNLVFLLNASSDIEFTGLAIDDAWRVFCDVIDVEFALFDENSLTYRSLSFQLAGYHQFYRSLGTTGLTNAATSRKCIRLNCMHSLSLLLLIVILVFRSS